MTAIYRNFYTKYRDLYGPDTCVLLLVGKFYELYDYIDESGEPLTPIKRVSQMMSLTLKDKEGLGPKGQPGLWSGFPEQSLHKFAQTLTSQGWVVVVVDQVKDITNQVIDRIPTRILSPGTHIETAGQDRLSVAALHLTPINTAIAVNDLTTGEVFTFESEQDDDILHMIQVFCVKEVVINDSVGRDAVRNRFGCSVSAVFPNHFTTGDKFAREEYFRKMFRVKGLLPVRTALDLDVSEQVEGALTTLLRFVEDHFPKESERLTSHTKYSPEGHMRLSNNILEQLNILSSQKSILSMLDRTHSSIGKRALRERILRPVTSAEELEARWRQVEFAHSVELKKVLERDLKGLYDLPRLHFKMAAGSVGATDILQLFQTYSSTVCLIENLRGSPLECTSALESKISEFRSTFKATFDEGKASRRNADEPVGFLTDSAGPETAALEAEAAASITAWQNTLATFCREVGVPVDSFSIKTDSDGEYILEMGRNKAIEKKLEASKTFLNSKNLLPGFEMDSKKSGPVRVTCSDFYTFSQKLRSTVYKLNKTLAKESLVVCDSMWDSVKGFQNEWTAWLGRVDCSFALASASASYGWCKPRLGEHLDIQGLRHPLLESQQTRAKYVTHDVSLGVKARGWLIYGVNASGKSSLMKATGIAVILAQAGSYVPASQMTIRPYDAAFSRIWNQDNIWAGLSSFAVEVKELADILKLSTSRSLVLGDEVCSGTESYSATALVAATLESLEAKGAHFIFATHLHDLLKVPGLLTLEGISVWHLRVLQEGGKLIYDRSLQPGSGSSTYGLEVAKAMGLPTDLMTRAYAIRRQLGGAAAADEAPSSSWNSAIKRQACEHCGATVVRDLEVHHIHERAKGGNNHVRNLVVLCEACHDKHHAKEIDILPLTQTSEGLERFSYKPEPIRTAHAKGFTEDQIETIKATVTNLKGRPAQRIATELQEVHGIKLTVAQLKKFLAP